MRFGTLIVCIMVTLLLAQAAVLFTPWVWSGIEPVNKTQERVQETKK